MGFGVIDIALGIMIPLVERPLPAQRLADDVAALAVAQGRGELGLEQTIGAGRAAAQMASGTSCTPKPAAARISGKTKASEPLVVGQSEIVDLGAPQELQQEITAGTENWIEQFRATSRTKYPDVQPIEHCGRAADEGQLVNRVGPKIETVVHF